jgi:UDP-N-acetyl-D-mannosaminuronate dehydrogenase
MVHLIVGHGEVGKALHKVLGKAEYVDRHSHTWNGEPVDVVHICTPYTDHFAELVRSYQPFGKMVIVHSSVPVGTCDDLGVVHSPIRGVHPHLAKGIRTFVKYFGGKDAKKAATIFCDLGIRTRTFSEARTTEAIKLWDTTQYGKLIMLEKQIYDWCQKNNLDFNAVYRQANKDYNDGYTKLRMPHVVRPYLNHMPGPIGGHCVLPNAKLLGVKL